ncbi:MAG TPA: helix-turn-helix domain-containing protein [Xanthomonadales bacterium]|nr:helix-turn-helix domain-containing protein [Xanthomonadales bacterium]
MGEGLKLGVLALDGAMLGSIAAAFDTLRVARKLAEIRDPQHAPRLETVLVSARGAERVHTSGGFELGGVVPPPTDLDWLIVPGTMHESPADVAGQAHAAKPEIALLQSLARRGVKLASACCGSFLLAEAGLLDGRRATTSWWLAAAFRQRYPAVRLEPDAMLVEDEGVITTGGSTAVLQLMLRLVAQAGGEALAQNTARLLVIESDRQSQAPYVVDALIAKPRSSLSERAEKFLQRELHREISVAQLAEHVGASERSLLRHFRSHYGASPIAQIQRMRVERAKALLEATHLSFDEIVARCGYSDTSSFRKLFKRATSLTPADYRQRFALRAQ